MKHIEILNAFNSRHAAKEFSTQKINDEDFKTILEAGRLSPSSFGLEPWKFLIVQNPELRNKIKQNAFGGVKQLDSASHFIVFLAAKAPLIKYDSPALKNFMQQVKNLPENTQVIMLDFLKNFQQVDFKLDTEKKLFDWSCRQVYIALGNMMTTAALLGIDSCPIEGFNEEKINEVLGNDFGIDTRNYGVAVMCAFGFRVNDPERKKTRRNLEDVIQLF